MKAPRAPVYRAWLLLVLPVGALLGQQPESRFASTSCHIAFAYPSTWEVVRDTDPKTSCDFQIRPKDWRQQLVAEDSVDRYSISLQSVDSDPATAAPEYGFERRGRRWVILGEPSAQPADTVSGPGWHGWHGIASARCYKIDGPYAGVCDEPLAIVGTATRSILIRAEPQGEDVFARLLKTLRLE